MLSRSDDDFRNFQNYTRLLDCDRNNFIKPNGIDQYENPDPLNVYMIQDPYVMNPEGASAEEYAALNVNNPPDITYGCKIPEGYNPLGVENLNENFPNKINWPQGPNPFLMQEEFNQFDYPYSTYLNNLYESQAFERNMEEVPPQAIFDNSLAFDPQLNFNNFYANDPGYYCPNPMEYPQGTFPPNTLINPRSLALAAQNPQIPPGVDSIPTSNFNQTLDNIPSSAPIPLSKFTKLSKNSPFVMPPLHGNGMNQHYRLPNHPSQKFFHYVNGNRLPPNVKDVYRKAGTTSALVNDVVTTNPLAMTEALVNDATINNARNFAIPSTSAEMAKQLTTKTENTIVKAEKVEKGKAAKSLATAKTDVSKKEESLLAINDSSISAAVKTTTVAATTSTTTAAVSTTKASTDTSVITTASTNATTGTVNGVAVKTEIEPVKIEIDVKNVASLKQDSIKKEENPVTNITSTATETKPITTITDVKVINAQVNVTVPPSVIGAVSNVDSIRAAPAAEVTKPLQVHSNNVMTTAPAKIQNSNTITTANGVVRVRKRHQVKVACVNCRKACKKCDENRPCARCIKMDLCSTCVDGERKPREKGVRRGPYKRQKQLQQNSPNDAKVKGTEKDGLQKTRQKRKKTQKQLKQEAEAENAAVATKNVTVNTLQGTNPAVTNATVNLANPLQVQNPDPHLLQTTLPQDPTLQLGQPSADLLNGTQPYNDIYSLYGNENMYLNYYPSDLYYCPPSLNSYAYPITEGYALPPDKVGPSLEECESFYKINPETSSPSTTNASVSAVRSTPNDKLINLSSSTSEVLSAINTATPMDTAEI